MWIVHHWFWCLICPLVNKYHSNIIVILWEQGVAPLFIHSDLYGLLIFPYIYFVVCCIGGHHRRGRDWIWSVGVHTKQRGKKGRARAPITWELAHHYTHHMASSEASWLSNDNACTSSVKNSRDVFYYTLTPNCGGRIGLHWRRTHMHQDAPTK